MTTVSTGNAISPELKCSCMTSQLVCKATSHVVCGWAHKTACIFFCATIVCLCWFVMWPCDTWACYIDRRRRNILITLFPPAHTRERERERTGSKRKLAIWGLRVVWSLCVWGAAQSKCFSEGFGHMVP